MCVNNNNMNNDKQTVGSGQGEVGVADVADCVLLVLPPAAGGALQVRLSDRL